MSDSEPRWEVSLTRQAEKMLYRLPKNLLQRLDHAILALATNPRPSESQALPGHHNIYRLPINGWRIAYAIEEERRLVLILEIASKQQPERYRLEEELDEVSLPQEIKDRNELFAKANLPDFLAQLPETNLLDEQSFTRYVGDAFKELKERIQARLLADLDPTIDISRPNELGRTILGERFEQILAQENIILSRSERERLFESIVAEILETELDEAQKRVLGQWFKFFKLGNNVEISLSVADLSESLSFYKKFDLEKVDSGEKPYPWAVVSDGRFYLGLHQQVFSSPTLSYFTLHGLSERIDHLPKLGVKLDNIQKLAPIQGIQNNALLYGLKFITAEFASPEGQRVLLAELGSDVETTPSGRKFFSKYEAFAELSLSTSDVNAALAYWERLGFECLADGDRPYPWAVVSDGRIRLGLHQTTKFTKPAITYFAPDMPDRLKRLRRRGIRFLTEYKDKKRRRIGAAIESPDGQRFFLFTGEIRSLKRNEAKAAKTAEGYKPEPNPIRTSFQLGQKVRIIEGPFADFMGTVDEIDPDRARVVVLVSYFGRETPVELEFWQVEPG